MILRKALFARQIWLPHLWFVAITDGAPDLFCGL